MEQSKRCSKCHEIKALSEFHRRSDRGGLGVQPHCKACGAKKHRAWYERNKTRLPNYPERKTCWKCKRTLAASAFGICRSYADGLNPKCRECARSYAMEIGNPSGRLRDPNGRSGALWTNYRLRPGQYQELLDAQRNACAICREPFVKTPHVDHSHETGAVRGILCHRCNTWLWVFERPGFAEKAMNYLKQHGTGGY